MDESPTSSFLIALRSDVSLTHAFEKMKGNFNQIEVLVKETTVRLKSVKTHGTGLFALISAIWRQNYSDTVVFTAEHESALLEFIYVEKFGWKTDDANYWYMVQGTTTRQSPLSYRNKLIGGSIKKVVKNLKSYINKKISNRGQQRQVAK